MTNIRSFRDLRVWRQGIEIVKETYEFSRRFPKSEIYGLAGQMQRAAVSVPSNIAEGHIRAHTKEFLQFLRVSLSSCAELETQAIIAHELGYISKDDFESYLRNIHSESKQIRMLIKKLSNP